MSRRPQNGRHPLAAVPQPPQPQPGTPCAELVLRFNKRLANDPVPQEILDEASRDEEFRDKDIRLWKELNPTIKVFRQADMGIQGETVMIKEAGASQHFFHWHDIESVEAVPGKIEVVG